MQLESKAEASKLKMYFPPHRGFRWSLGGRGMYVGGKDLTVAELGGGFRLSTQTVQRNGQAVALVLFELGAASGTDAVVAGYDCVYFSGVGGGGVRVLVVYVFSCTLCFHHCVCLCECVCFGNPTWIYSILSPPSSTPTQTQRFQATQQGCFHVTQYQRCHHTRWIRCSSATILHFHA